MKIDLLPRSGKYYKASMHTHSTVSDGKFSPEEVKRMYMEQGYSIIAYTDHEILIPHNDLSDENFLALTSYEVSLSEKREGPSGSRRCCHLNVYAKDPEQVRSAVFSMRYVKNERMQALVPEEAKEVDYVREYDTDAINDLIARANADGCLVCFNHPVWSQQNYPDYAGLKGLWGMEVYNYSCEVYGYRETPQPYYDLLHEGELVFPVSSDDSHSEIDYAGGWIMVNADSLTYKSVMDSLARGDFYASAGPEIYEFSVDGGHVHVSCSEAVSIALATERRTLYHAWAGNGAPRTEADFDIQKYIDETKAATAFPWKPFIRLEVTDKYGKVAYTRAYRFDEFVKDA